MDKSKHKQIKYVDDEEKLHEEMEHFTFHHAEEVDGIYEVKKHKRRINLNNPIHVSIAIYQLAKLRMLQFYYDLIDKYIDRSDFQYLEMDTDSAYIAFSDDNPFPNLIKPELLLEYEAEKDNWFPRETHKAFDKRKAGLFKEEWRGNAMISLSSKNYICYEPDEYNKVKVSSKGVQKSRNEDILSPEGFENVIENAIVLKATIVLIIRHHVSSLIRKRRTGLDTITIREEL